MLSISIRLMPISSGPGTVWDHCLIGFLRKTTIDLRVKISFWLCLLKELCLNSSYCGAGLILIVMTIRPKNLCEPVKRKAFSKSLAWLMWNSGDSVKGHCMSCQSQLAFSTTRKVNSGLGAFNYDVCKTYGFVEPFPSYAYMGFI